MLRCAQRADYKTVHILSAERACIVRFTLFCAQRTTYAFTFGILMGIVYVENKVARELFRIDYYVLSKRVGSTALLKSIVLLLHYKIKKSIQNFSIEWVINMHTSQYFTYTYGNFIN